MYFFKIKIKIMIKIIYKLIKKDIKKTQLLAIKIFKLNMKLVFMNELKM